MVLGVTSQGCKGRSREPSQWDGGHRGTRADPGETVQVRPTGCAVGQDVKMGTEVRAVQGFGPGLLGESGCLD